MVLGTVGGRCGLLPSQALEAAALSGELGGDAVDVECAGRAVDDVVVDGPLDAGRASDHLEVSEAGDGVAPGGVPGAGHLLEVWTFVVVASDAGEVHDRGPPKARSCDL